MVMLFQFGAVLIVMILTDYRISTFVCQYKKSAPLHANGDDYDVDDEKSGS